MKDTRPMPSHAPASRASASASPSPKRPFPALPAMTAGLVWTAAAWLGLALFVIAVAYPMTDLARVALTLLGSTLVAAAIAFAIAARPERV